MKLSSYFNVSSTKRLLLFLFLNFLFWVSPGIQTLIYAPEMLINPRRLMWLFIGIFEAFLISLFLRHVFKTFGVPRYSMGKLIIVTLASTILCALLWFYVERTINLIWRGANPFFNVLFTIKEEMAAYISALWYRAFYFLTWCALYLGYKIWEQWNEEKLRAERERSFANQTQLEMLRYQLNPHFLFNTLSSLRALIRQKNNNTAEDMVTKISEFLKYSLLEVEKNKVPLSREIKIIKHYFDIEKVRFSDELLVQYSIDPLAEDFPIPVFLIHPLIENAVKHGMKTSPSPLRISITAQVINDYLHIDVINSGQWHEAESDTNHNNTGTGLKNTRRRLELAYPDQHSFEIIKHENTVQVKIRINNKIQ